MDAAQGEVRPGDEGPRPFPEQRDLYGLGGARRHGPRVARYGGAEAATCEFTLGGLWLDCRFEQDRFAEGQPVVRWEARRIIGWDRAVGADTNGVVFIFRGGSTATGWSWSPLGRRR